MKAGIYFTGSGPLLALTTHDSLVDDALVEAFAEKGVRKFIVYEVDLELVKGRYGDHFNVVMNDTHQTDDLRILDSNGNHIFAQFSLSELGGSVIYEPEQHEHHAWPLSWEAYHKVG